MKNRNLSDRQPDDSFISSLKRKLTFFGLSIAWLISKASIRRYITNHLFVPRKYHTSEQEIQFLAKARSFEIESNGDILRGWKWEGQGAEILVWHGWNGRGIQLLPVIRKLLEAGYSVFTFDAPGHGESEGLKSSYFQFTDALRDFLKDSRWKIDCVIAHSLGGSAVINAISKDHIPLLPILIASPLHLRELLYEAFAFHGVPPIVYKTLTREYEERFGYSLEKDNPGNLLPTFQQELIMLHDTEDPVVPYEGIKRATKDFPNIKFITTTGLGHKAMLQDREVLNLIIELIHQRINKSMTA
jgi:pimeloyl-ACP methyl ester carboxylesterase